jgi:acetoin utilization deacetylase AcuC-like enzyme
VAVPAAPLPCAAVLAAPLPCAAVLAAPLPCAAVVAAPLPCAVVLAAPLPCAAVLGYLFDARVLAHDPPPATLTVGGRPFTLGTADVAQALLTAQANELVERSRLSASLERLSFDAAPGDALRAVHTPAYLERLEAASAGGPWDGEHAPVTPATWAAATLTAGGVLAAVEAVLRGRQRRALVHARPAGHHAEPDRAIASTYLNNLACGAEHARRLGVERVAIVDWDVHVGNGAERIFWDRPDVLAVSLHQRDWYPDHAGALAARGGPGAEGATVNVPLPAGTTDAGYLLALETIVAPVLRGFRPDLILVAAGQDASVYDPMGRMLVSAAGFRALAGGVAELAEELCDGRLVVATEGGYSPIYNPFCLLAVLEGLAGEDGGVPDPWEEHATVRATRAPAGPAVRDALGAVGRAQPRWFP